MVAVPGLGTSAPPAVRRPVVDLVAGGGADDWRPWVARVSVVALLAPEVGRTLVVVAASPAAPSVAVGDPASVALGYGDGDTTTVATGTVAAVTEALDGTRTVVVHDAAAVLASTRVDQGYAEQSSADVIADLAGRVGVDVTRVDGAGTHPSLVVHGRRSAWEHVARLARVEGLLARVDGDGALVVAPPDAGEPLAVDPATGALRLHATTHGTVAAGVTAVGEGAAGSRGADAWAWLGHDRAGVVAEAGDPTASTAVRVRDPGLRSPDAVRAAAEAAFARRGRLARTARLRVPGEPAVRPGAVVEVGGGDADPLATAGSVLGVGPGGGAGGPGAGRWLVTAVQHRLQGGFTTDLALVAADDGAGGPLPDLGF